MELVTTWEGIENNLNQLEKYRHSKDQREVEFYKGLLKLGICFIVYKRDGELSFAPSRFVGYANNNMSLHLSSQHKDGRETNSAISKILRLGKGLVEDDYLEKEFHNFCAKIKVEPKSACDHKRKYWSVT